MQLKAGDHVRERLKDRGHPKEHRTPGVLIFNIVNTNREIPEMPLSAKIYPMNHGKYVRLMFIPTFVDRQLTVRNKRIF
jgi:hypothetical protein